MNLASPLDVRKLLDEIGVRPNKSLGQNFLIDGNILNILIDSADLSDSDHVLEIGGGLGVVTEQLAYKAGKVTVIEKDRRLAEHLSKRFAELDNVEIICADAVAVLSKGKGSSITIDSFDKVVSNLPYSIGTKVLVDMIKSENRPGTIVVTVQMEVAERFVAECGKKDYGILSVWSHMHYDVDLIKAINGTCFWPKPDVKSGILRFKANSGVGMSSAGERSLYVLTKYAFGHRRKQMVNNLRYCHGDLRVEPDKAAKIFDRIGLELTARPQTLSVSDWVLLTDAVMEDS